MRVSTRTSSVPARGAGSWPWARVVARRHDQRVRAGRQRLGRQIVAALRVLQAQPGERHGVRRRGCAARRTPAPAPGPAAFASTSVIAIGGSARRRLERQRRRRRRRCPPDRRPSRRRSRRSRAAAPPSGSATSNRGLADAGRGWSPRRRPPAARCRRRRLVGREADVRHGPAAAIDEIGDHRRRLVRLGRRVEDADRRRRRAARPARRSRPRQSRPCMRRRAAAARPARCGSRRRPRTARRPAASRRSARRRRRRRAGPRSPQFTEAGNRTTTAARFSGTSIAPATGSTSVAPAGPAAPAGPSPRRRDARQVGLGRARARAAPARRRCTRSPSRVAIGRVVGPPPARVAW